MIAMGASLGGLQAFEKLLSQFPKDFRVPLTIVQHRHKTSAQQVAQFLQPSCSLPVVEVEDKMEILPGQIYIAPADYHLLVETSSVGEKCHFSLSTEAVISYARPSIDVLFESVAAVFSHQAIGLILTGANADGAKGLALMKAMGGTAIVQEPATADCPVMPKAAIAATPVDWILPLGEIVPCLINLCELAYR